jgi:hypothetical protein
MTVQGEVPEAAARKAKVKCPPAKKAEILRAIALHQREHGNCNWHLVRQHPDFAPWIGEASGPSGRRKFFHWKKKLRRPLPADRTRPHDGRGVNEDQQAWATLEAEAAAQAPNQLVALSPRHIMADGATAVAGFPQLAQKLGQGFDDIERVRRAALLDDPHGYKGQSAHQPDLLLKAVRETRELTRTSTGFLREYNVLLGLEEFNHDLLQLLGGEFPAEPERRDHLLDLVADLISRHGRGAPGRN